MKLSLLLLLLPVLGQSQTFFVSGSDTYSVHKVAEKIKSEGYQTTDSSKADYIVNLLIDGAYKVISFKRDFQGYVTIVDRESGKELWKSPVEKASPSLYNGYNASYRIFEKIEKKYLPDELKKCPKISVVAK
jgi:hypothetical protein